MSCDQRTVRVAGLSLACALTLLSVVLIVPFPVTANARLPPADGQNHSIYPLPITSSTGSLSNTGIGSDLKPVGKVLNTLDLWNNTLFPGNYVPNYGMNPDFVAVDTKNGDEYVTNLDTNNVAVINQSDVIGWITVEGGPWGISFDSSNGNLYVTDAQSNNVTVIDGSTNQVIGNISVGIAPAYVTYDSDNGEVFVGVWGCEPTPLGPCTFDHSAVVVINGTTDAVVSSIPLRIGESPPEGMAFDGESGYLYVTTNFNTTMTVIDGNNNSVVGLTPGGTGPKVEPTDAVYDHLNGFLYVVDWISSNITIVDPSSNSILRTIPLGLYASNPDHICLDDSSGYLYVSYDHSNLITRIDGSTNAVLGNIQLNSAADGMACDDTGGNLYAANPDSDTVSVVNESTDIVVTIHIGTNCDPISVAFDDANSNVYVANYNSNNISVISGKINKVVRYVPVATGDQGPINMAFDSMNLNLYVADANGSNVNGGLTIVNSTTDSVTGRVSVGETPKSVVYDNLTDQLFVVELGDDSFAVINGSSNAITAVISSPIPAPVDAAFDYSNGDMYVTAGGCPESSLCPFSIEVVNVSSQEVVRSIAVSYWPGGIAYDGSNENLYVAEGYLANGTGTNSVTVINGANNSVIGSIPTGYYPNGVTYDPLNGYVYVVNMGDCTQTFTNPCDNTPSNVTVIDGATDAVVGSIPVGTGATWAAFDSENGYIYVTNSESATVSIISPFMGVSPLSSVSVSPSAASLVPGERATFNATPMCIGGNCPPATYSWTLNNSIGTLNTTAGATVTFTVGSASGLVTLIVNVTIDGITVQSSPVSIVISPPLPTLASVSVAPSMATMNSRQSQTFSASIMCNGGNCPAGATYTWNLSSLAGGLNSTTRSVVSFAAGTTAGTVGLFVNVTLNGMTRSASTTITITSPEASGTGLFGLPGTQGYYVLVIVAAAVVVVATVWIRALLPPPKKNSPPTPSPVTEPSKTEP
jgi:YVTN family beta-propeller protein